MPFRPLPRDSARRYVDTETGEIISRRQYDKLHGTLKKQGYSSYEQKAKIRESAGLHGKRLADFVVSGSHSFPYAKSKHIYVKTSSDNIGPTVSQLLRDKGMKQTNVAVRVRDKNGKYKQSKSFKPTNKTIGTQLSSAASGIVGEYDLDIDYNDDGSYDVELVWSEAA